MTDPHFTDRPDPSDFAHPDHPATCETCGGDGYVEEREGGVSKRVDCPEEICE